MKALIVYDSTYGNTEQIARAIGHAFAAQGEVEVLHVGDVKPEQLTGVQYLIVGSPTQGFGPTAAIRTFLGGIPADGLKGVKVAAFDTRMLASDIESPILRPLGGIVQKLFGFAAQPISKQLENKGGERVVPAEGFVVEGTEGPLKEGELERAADWAKQITAAQ